MESSRSVRTPTILFTEKSEKSQYRIKTTGDIYELKDDVSSTKHTMTQNSENNNTRSNIKKAAKNMTKHSQITKEVLSPKRTLSHSKSLGSKKRPFHPHGLQTIGPVRTETYSPVNSIRVLLSHQKGSPKLTDFDPGSFFYESPGTKKINFGNSSIKIMQKVFDQEYSLHSPSKRKAAENEFYESFRQADSLQTNNNAINNPGLTKRFNLDFEILNNAYKTFLEKLQSDLNIKNVVISSYVSRSLEYLNHPDFDYKLGSLLIIFDMIYYNKSRITEEQIAQVCAAILSMLPEYQALEDHYLLSSALEILSINQNISFFYFFSNNWDKTNLIWKYRFNHNPCSR